jgi:hypothetical protein
MDFFSDKAVVTAVVCSLVGAVLDLWRRIAAHSKKIEEKLESCEKEHRRRDSDYLDLNNKLVRMEDEQEGVKSLANQVLMIIANSNNENNKNNKL